MKIIEQIKSYLNKLGVSVVNEETLADYVDQINSGEVIAIMTYNGKRCVIRKVDAESGTVEIEDLESGEVYTIEYAPDIEISVGSDDDSDDGEDIGESAMRVKNAYKYINNGKYKGVITKDGKDYVIVYIDPVKWEATTEEGEKFVVNPYDIIRII